MTAAPTNAARRAWGARPETGVSVEGAGAASLYRSEGGRSRARPRSPGSGGAGAGGAGESLGGSIAVNRIGSWRRTPPHARLAIVKHPSLGLPERDQTSGFPEAADRLRAATARLGVRALEIAVERDPTLRNRYDELGLRHLLRDSQAFVDRIVLSVANGDPSPMREFADQVVPLYRRRRVPMDDLIQLSEGLRAAMAPFVDGPEADSMHAAIDAGIAQMRWNRRIAGDARKRNRLLAFLYKGA
jgi:hypothetical protein